MPIRRLKKLFHDHFNRNRDKMILKIIPQSLHYHNDKHSVKLIGNLSRNRPKINTIKGYMNFIQQIV